MRTHRNQRHDGLRFVVVGIVGIVGVLVAPVLAPATAHAAGTSTAVCAFDLPVTLAAPGVSTAPADFAFTSGGDTGTVICLGTIRGHPVTGPGKISDQGTGSGSCTSGTVTGAYTLTVPTEAGPQEVRVPYADLPYVGALGARPTPEFAGGFTFVPKEGDCVSAPLTEVVLAEFGVLKT